MFVFWPYILYVGFFVFFGGRGGFNRFQYVVFFFFFFECKIGHDNGTWDLNRFDVEVGGFGTALPFCRGKGVLCDFG